MMRICHLLPRLVRIMGPRVRMVLAVIALAAMGTACLPGGTVCAAEGDADSEASEARLKDSVSYLASDEMEGRGVGTDGLNKAADYIAGQFKKMGLDVGVFDGSPFQVFQFQTGSRLGDKNELSFVQSGPAGGEPKRITLAMESQFTPMALGGSGKFDLPIVFVGYGITAPDKNYDDYAGVDVKDKAVLMLRHEPRQDDEQSPFDGRQNSPHSTYQQKLSTAYEHGAAAVLFCTDAAEIRRNVILSRKGVGEAVDALAARQKAFAELEYPTREETTAFLKDLEELSRRIRVAGEELDAEYDPIVPFQAGASRSARPFPVLYLRRSAADPMVQQALGKSLAELETAIDADLKPHSMPIEGWRMVGEVTVERTSVEVKNVAAVLEGDGPLADETIIIGAHYDHLGRGQGGSLNPGSREIHNGADDNGSGTAAVIEVARRLTARGQKLPRRVMFMAFTAEERGLIGSNHYVENPKYPLEKTIAMLNMDMVGRLAANRLIVCGTGTSSVFDPLLTELNESTGFTLARLREGFGPSDHSSFYGKKVPVLHFFTDLHQDYHRPSDDTEKLNIEGMRRVADLVTEMTLRLATTEARPDYVEIAGSAPIGRSQSANPRPRFGSQPDYSYDKPGVRFTVISSGSPADKAGVKAGDVLIQFGDSKVGTVEDFENALRKHRAGDKVAIVVKRGEQEVTLEVTLERGR
jgi:hypothetical protein